VSVLSYVSVLFYDDDYVTTGATDIIDIIASCDMKGRIAMPPTTPGAQKGARQSKSAKA
jgi:hypothetical protein